MNVVHFRFHRIFKLSCVNVLYGLELGASEFKTIKIEDRRWCSVFVVKGGVRDLRQCDSTPVHFNSMYISSQSASVCDGCTQRWLCIWETNKVDWTEPPNINFIFQPGFVCSNITCPQSSLSSFSRYAVVILASGRRRVIWSCCVCSAHLHD